MHKNKNGLRGLAAARKRLGIPRALAGLGLLAAAAGLGTAAQAQPAQGTQGGISVHAGVGEHYKRLGVNYETPSFWTHRFGSDWGRLDLVGELGVAYWQADGSRSPGHVWQFNAVPMFRWWIGASERAYIEAGIGATVFTSTRFADEAISTAFQFGDHIGAGFLINDANRIGIRYSHFSNASIKRPNPGLDVLQLTYTYQF
ncbi:acyloxyacyl hydrolase [Orrella sp. JC864]|uniref:acyloxyacyl hydrolase n=1 Tax=Orrella sp. JC864 TaxID=3120298 RepID=UPI0012BD66F6